MNFFHMAYAFTPLFSSKIVFLTIRFIKHMIISYLHFNKNHSFFTIQGHF